MTRQPFRKAALIGGFSKTSLSRGSLLSRERRRKRRKPILQVAPSRTLCFFALAKREEDLSNQDHFPDRESEKGEGKGRIERGKGFRPDLLQSSEKGDPFGRDTKQLLLPHLEWEYPLN